MKNFDASDEALELAALEAQLEEFRAQEKAIAAGAAAEAAAAAAEAADATPRDSGESADGDADFAPPPPPPRREPRTTITYGAGSSLAVRISVSLPPRGGAGVPLPRSIMDLGAEPLEYRGRVLPMRIEVTRRGAVVLGVDSRARGGPRAVDPRRLERLAANFDESAIESETGPDARTRRMLARVCFSDAYDAGALVFTVWSCLNLALEAPYLSRCGDASPPAACANTSTPALSMYLLVADGIVAFCLLAEVGVRVFIQGIWKSPHAYFRSRWNVADAGVALLSAVAFFVSPLANRSSNIWLSRGSTLRAVRVVRAARALRVLRFFRHGYLSHILDTVTAMGPGVINAATLIALFLYIFAVIGLQSFMGSLNVCNDFSVSRGADCVGNFTLVGRNCAFLPTEALEAACKAMGSGSNFTFPRIFEAQNPNWDNFGNAILQVYMLSDGENWNSLM